MSDEYSIATNFTLGKLKPEGYARETERLCEREDPPLVTRWNSVLGALMGQGWHDAPRWVQIADDWLYGRNGAAPNL